MTAPAQNAAIRFETDGYDISKPNLMGRQAAGAGFLRAAVAARGDAPLYGYGPNPRGAEIFAAFVATLDPSVETRWIASTNQAGLNAVGVCYLPGPSLAEEAHFRLRVGPARHSLCGITHTTATERAMTSIAKLLVEPVMPWDALICTSDAVRETVRQVHETQTEMLRWRLGPQVRIAPPQLPVIPLGVHCSDFASDSDERARARAALGLEVGDVRALFVGRITFAGKAHPLPMYQALEAAARRTGKRVVLVQCGWSLNDKIANAMVQGAATYAPSVRSVFVDGREPPIRRQAWVAADLFVSLSDNIQETFGLTPLEAMAAGLPVLVSDWNGYRQTVQDGVHGFRVRTWAPPDGAGADLAAAYECGAINYDRYCWAAVAATSLDLGELCDRATDLVGNPELRRRMGEAGRATAKANFDWALVYRQYQDLWAELNARRLASAADPEEMAWLLAAPRSTAQGIDPFRAFGHYPTATVDGDVVATLLPGVDFAAFRKINSDVLFIGARLAEDRVARVFDLLQGGAAPVAACVKATGLAAGPGVRTVSALAKMGLLRLDPPAA